MEIIPARVMNSLYIYLDIVFLLVFAFILYKSKRHLACIVGLLGGLLYFIVDYGYFYLILGTREVMGADPLWFLLWLSISYGFTNFVWIWLWLDNDGNKLEWSVFIMTGWLCTALLSQSFGQAFPIISITRGTGAYHGIMALLLFVGYGLLCYKNITREEGSPKIPIFKILAIGILVQGAWELVLLITGIRQSGINTMIVNALLETNMGLPYLYLIHKAIPKRRSEKLNPAACQSKSLQKFSIEL